MENIPQVFDGYLNIGLQGVWYICLACVVVHVAVLTYHWFAYGTSRTINLLSLGAYIGGAAILLFIMYIALGNF